MQAAADMPRRKPTWTEKLERSRPPEVAVLDRPFADMPEGCRMLIASPLLVDAEVRRIPPGRTVAMAELRAALAAAHGADKTCPLTAGIFLRIVSEAEWEQLQAGAAEHAVAPFWRAVDPASPLAKKLPCGPDFIRQRRAAETST